MKYLGPDKIFFSTNGDADAFDLGILAEVPIIIKMPLGDNFNFNLSASAGYTFANWGSDMVYSRDVYDFGEPIARTARLGYGLRTSIDYKYKEAEFKLLQIDWSSEANDLLVKNEVPTIYNGNDSIYTVSQSYKSPIGDINIWDNIVMMKNTSNSVINRHGVKFSLLETADFSFGRYGLPGSYDMLRGSTLGFSIGTKGIMKIMSQEIKNNIIEFISKHISFQYSYSRIKFDERMDEYGYIFRHPDQSYYALYLVISELW
ncbi:MAG: hypothetical protein HZB41_06770 [Ignavibacteriae bacterium]|nr:hypothetical protein [Ignavibacteriota bacterium]